MRNGIEKTILLFVLVDFANQEHRVHNQSRDDQAEENNSKPQRNDFPPVEHNPGNVERDRQADQAGAQRHEDGYLSCSVRYSHRRLRETILARMSRKREKSTCRSRPAIPVGQASACRVCRRPAYETRQAEACPTESFGNKETAEQSPRFLSSDLPGALRNS